MNMIDNKDIIYTDVYNIIVEGSHWPSFFSLDMKIKMIQETKDYFEEREEYSRVDILEKISLELQK